MDLSSVRIKTIYIALVMTGDKTVDIGPVYTIVKMTDIDSVNTGAKNVGIGDQIFENHRTY